MAHGFMPKRQKLELVDPTTEPAEKKERKPRAKARHHVPIAHVYGLIGGALMIFVSGIAIGAYGTAALSIFQSDTLLKQVAQTSVARVMLGNK